MTFARILVPTDFSPPSLEAALAGASLAAGHGGRVTLLHVYNPPSVMLPDGSTFPPAPEELVAATIRADHLLDEARRALQARLDTPVSIELASRIGDAAAEIVAAAESGRYDVVVMGTHGRSGVRRMLLGSVAEKVIRHAPIPVMTVRAGETAEQPLHHM